MESNAKKTTKWARYVVVGVLALAAFAMLGVKLQTNISAFAHNAQTTFDSPDDAGAALAKAAKSDDETGLAEILGINTKTLLTTGDNETDKATMETFASKYQKMNRWIDMTDGSRVLYVGADNFAFPVPLAKNPSGRWYFDGIAGAEEVGPAISGATSCSPWTLALQLPTRKMSTSPAPARRKSTRSGSSAARVSRTACIGPRRKRMSPAPWEF